jgi:hypothetical protein
VTLTLQSKPVRSQQQQQHKGMPTLRQTVRSLQDAIRQNHESMHSVDCVYRGLGLFEVIGRPGMRAHLKNPALCSQSFHFGMHYCMDIVDVKTAKHGRGLVRFDLLLDPEGPRVRTRAAALARG